MFYNTAPSSGLALFFPWSYQPLENGPRGGCNLVSSTVYSQCHFFEPCGCVSACTTLRQVRVQMANRDKESGVCCVRFGGTYVCSPVFLSLLTIIFEAQQRIALIFGVRDEKKSV